MTTMAAFRAELLKLRKRPGVWILLGVMFAIVLLFGYVLLYVVATQAPPDQAQGFDPSQLLALLRPDALLIQVLGIVAGPGIAIAVILGALAVGGDYGWRTVKTMLTQGPQRAALMGGRLAGLGVACVAIVAAAFAGGLGGAGLVSLLEPAPGTWPDPVDIAAAVGIALLVVGVWCALAVCLATVFRGTAWAIGIGLLYAFAVESVLSLVPLSGTLGEVISQVLIGNNVSALIVDVLPEAGVAFQAPGVEIAGLQAGLVLGAYLVVALVVATVVFVRRDVAN